ncbi:MAG TPA: helix-turn-helix transcriptional regulator [Candidatus Atribacteria bacterium]|jgi:transcriptional regulator with XRE-family HTH domain|nr:helix-turn-helix transcriptional regulator [Candidatus Atribacteria bacterium]
MKKGVAKAGSYFKKLRMNKDLTIGQLSLLSGVSKSTISMIERNKHNPTADTVIKLSKALNQTPEDMLSKLGFIQPIPETLDSKLERIAKEFDTLFLDHLGELDEDSKQKLISYLEFLIQKQDKGLAKKDNTQ